MIRVEERDSPKDSLLHQYTEKPGCHADAFMAEINFTPSLKDYITAMFGSPVFRIERVLLAVAAATPTFKKDLTAFALAEKDSFALWKTMERSDQELLMEVEKGRVRTWLMVEPTEGETSKLWFGSAIVPKTTPSREVGDIGFTFKALMGFHKLYSRILLLAAIRGLKRT